MNKWKCTCGYENEDRNYCGFCQKRISMSSLSGLNIVKSEFLVGAKRALMSNSTVYVSPAMYDLLCKEKGDDLTHLLKSLTYVDVSYLDAAMLMDRRLTK